MEGEFGLQAAPNVPIIPQARKCNFEQFVNRFSLAQAGYAIEYLEAGTELGMEMAYEVSRRRRGKVKGYEDKTTGEYKSRRFDNSISSGAWIRAVRIQSPAVLNALSEVSRYNWGTEPYTFMRPFGHLIHFHPRIKAKLESIKATSLLMEHAGNSQIRDEIQHLECYISFIEEHILPLVHQFDDASHSNPRRIRHDDLWYLFRPGELIYVPLKALGVKDPLLKNDIHQKVWRLEVFQPHEGDLELPMRGGVTKESDGEAHVYFIDHDGSAYKAVRLSVTIEYFDGEKEIRSLEVYPIRFASGSEAMIEESHELGKKFTECIEQQHVSYKAWTLLTDPTGRYAYNKGKKVTSPEFVDGDVIINFQEAFNAQPMWRYNYGLESTEWSSEVLTIRDKFPILLWSDASRSKLLFEWPNIVVSDDDISWIEGTAFGRQDPYGTGGLEKPREDDLVLLPRRLCGYGLRERKFFFLDVKEVKVGREHIDAFEFLQIDPNNKRIIHALLTDHFNTKQARKTHEIASQDPIPGKGHNLVFLLHGPPGVGKTATVEAVAQKYRKPLFAITSGDLGSTPDAVESSLTEIFHLANVWDCILLLDEADVFLEERQKSDLKRNAVVSVFLRVMEYYNGILFLTTNRTGQLDEAIKSRVHSALLYQTLSLEQTLEIFRVNIKRLEMIEKQRKAVTDPPEGYMYLQADKTGILAFAEKHWNQHDLEELGRWNGRQIRNAFISAAALARSDPDHSKGEGEIAVLTERHFQRIASSVTAFDKYMARARGALDSERARTRSDRHDGFDSGEESEPATRNRRPGRMSLGRTSRNNAGAPHTPTQSARLHPPSPQSVPSPQSQAMRRPVLESR
ncbi:P-loop containing nucleoside triphosphate hydrolase protein [Coniochaeta sp. PMI_546]|nr:P-loop containing nucleoside triphosphate hydrolase protein [Coniochaeta sp. PMI_546]